MRGHTEEARGNVLRQERGPRRQWEAPGLNA